MFLLGGGVFGRDAPFDFAFALLFGDGDLDVGVGDFALGSVIKRKLTIPAFCMNKIAFILFSWTTFTMVLSLKPKT